MNNIKEKIEIYQAYIYFGAVIVAMIFGLLLPDIAKHFSSFTMGLLFLLMLVMFLQLPFLS